MSAARPATSPRRQRRTSPTTVGWIAIIAFAFLAGIGAITAVAVVGIYRSLATDLPDPSQLTDYVLPEQTIVYDRTGKIELARFGDAKREVVTFDQIPKVLLDATTAVEDKTFWDNAGFDPVAIVSAAIDSLRGDSRGASTITQQLVRERLLPQDLVQDPNRTIERKLKEIIQSIRLTEAYKGEQGKQQIITAYLNQNYYGNQAYGVKAAVDSYFGIDISKIDPAQAAIIAGLPKSPSNYDLVRNHIETCTTVVAEGDPCPKSQWVVPATTTIVQRRNQILELLASGGRTPMSGDQYTPEQFKAAEQEPVVLSSQTTQNWIAPHFVWAVRDELTNKLCGDADTCDAIQRGGLRVTTTLDVGLQKIAEKWVKAAAIVPHAKNPTAAAKALGFKKLEPWMANLKDKKLRNGALVALDYQTGELVAYVGSADYYATSSKPEFQPQYDVVGKGYRQPGSAFKPFNYVTAIDDKKITAGTMLMDVGTDFGNYAPNDADNLERGPVRVRNALQFSLNIPAVKTMAINGPDRVFAKAQQFGIQFQGPRTAELALALGVQEVRPVDLVTAYGTLANGGAEIPHTTILAVKDANGTEVPGVPAYTPPAGKQVVSPQAAFIVTDILAGNTNPKVNPFWGKFSVTGPGGRRPATLKTGTNNDAKDLNAYGYIAPPTDAGRTAGAYALAVGVWDGNSDNSLVSTARSPLFSIDVSTYVWQGFLQEASGKWPVTDFKAPDGLVRVKIDPLTGFPTASSKNAVNEWYIAGTEPKDRLAPDTCGIDVVAAVHVESDHASWMQADQDWLRRAARGPGVAGGPNRTRTAYFYNGAYHPYGSTWGVLVGGSCGKPSPSPTCFVVPTPDANGVTPSFSIPTPTGSGVAALPCPPASPSATPSVEPSVEPSAPPTEPPPTETPTPTEKPTAKPKPTPTPTPEVTPEPSIGPNPS
ncbi:MAG TPA: transglycosylase domain-containing protein [Candidatus Limnocylindrales bacterium]|nr:transglycosylase domain-containing protein [Candidatus Limnocylindrales bacterium]